MPHDGEKCCRCQEVLSVFKGFFSSFPVEPGKNGYDSQGKKRSILLLLQYFYEQFLRMIMMVRWKCVLILAPRAIKFGGISGIQRGKRCTALHEETLARLKWLGGFSTAKWRRIAWGQTVDLMKQSAPITILSLLCSRTPIIATSAQQRWGNLSPYSLAAYVLCPAWSPVGGALFGQERVRVALDGVNCTLGGTVAALERHMEGVRSHDMIRGQDIDFKLSISTGPRNSQV